MQYLQPTNIYSYQYTSNISIHETSSYSGSIIVLPTKNYPNIYSQAPNTQGEELAIAMTLGV